MKRLYLLIVYLAMLQPLAAQDAVKLDTLIAKASAALYNNPNDAIALGKQAYSQAGNNHQKRIASLIIVSNGYFALKKTVAAQKYAFRALAFARAEGDYVNQVKVYGLLGNHYQVLKFNDKAREFLGQAESIMEKHPLPAELDYLKGNIFAVKGNSYKGDLDCDYAITYFDKAIYAFEHSAHPSAATNLKLVQVQKGFCLLDLEQPDAAAAIFNKITAQTSPTQMFDTWVYAYIGLARSHNQKKEYKQAITLLDDALANTPQGARTEVKCELYRNLSDNYLMAGDAKKYHYYNGLFHTAQQDVLQLTAQNFNEAINDMAVQAEAKLVASQAAHNTRRGYLYAIAALVLCCTIVILYRKKIRVQQLQQALFKKSLQ